MNKPIILADGNDNSVYLKGLLDETLAKDGSGNPNNINDATVTWTLTSAGGLTLASGNAVATGAGGIYRCDLSNLIDYEDAYTLTVTVVTTSGKKALFEASVADRSLVIITRTGATLYT